MKDPECETERVVDDGVLPQQLERRLLKEVLGVFRSEPETRARVGDELRPLLAVEDDGLRDLVRSESGDFGFHECLLPY